MKRKILAGFLSVIMTFGTMVTAYADEIPEGTQMDSVSEEEPETDIGSIDISADEMKNTEEKVEKTETEDTKDQEEEIEELKLFNIHISDIENGTVLVNGMGTDQVSAAGETIDVSVVPDEDYIIDTVSVVDTSKAQIDIAGSDGNYSFIMPESDVEISASFREKEVKAVASYEAVTKPQKTKAARAFGGNVSVVNYGYASMGRLGTANDAILTIDGNPAYCVNPEMHAPDTGTYDPSFYGSTTNQTLVNVLYYGYYGAGDITGNYGLTTDERHALTHMAAAKAFGGNWTYGLNSFGIQMVNQFMSDVAAKPQLTGTVMIFQQYVGGQNVAQLISYTVPEGDLKLTKESAVPEITNGNACYSLESAVYGVYSDAACTQKIGELKTDANGNTKKLTLKPGKYYVKELTAPKGYLKDTKVYTANITAGQTSSLDVKDIPGNDPIGILLQKLDAETGKASEKLAGAEYTIKYYDVTSEAGINTSVPKSTWVVKTNNKGLAYLHDSFKVSGDEFYKINGVAVLPLGYITIQETKAPDGYVLDDTIYTCQTKEDKGVIRTTNLPTDDNAIKEKYARGDLDLKKVDEDGSPIAGVPFKITSVETNESAVIVTDKNGYASTASSHNPHTQKTNEGTDATCGVWFRDEVSINDDVGALPLGSYIVEEQVCEANYGKKILDPIAVEITENAVTVHLGDLENKTIRIGTKAISRSTNTHLVPVSDSEEVVDKISYENLTVGKEYTFKGKIVDKATGDVIGTGEMTFTADNTIGTTEVAFTVSTKELAGKTLVVFEELFDESGKRADHTDIGDKDQTLYIPKIHTAASINGAKEVVAGGIINLTDTIHYTNLISGETYTAKGVLMDKTTGKELLINGKSVTSETAFTPDAPDGDVDVTFSFDSSKLSSKDLVVFEELYYEGVEVTTHKDIDDGGQTVKIKKVGKIVVKGGNNRTPKGIKYKNNPQTSDPTDATLFICLLLISSAAAILFSGRKLKRRNKDN